MKKLYGVTVAMTTPFDEKGGVDYEAMAAQAEMLIKKGVQGLYPCGTTGEMLRLSTEERKKIAERIVKTAAGRVLVYIHAGCMNEEDTIELARHACEIGADGVGVVTPQFFGVTDREMEEYYVRVAGSLPGDFPLYLYAIPQAAKNDIKPAVAERIAGRCKNVAGIKYSFADMNQTLEYLNIRGGSFSVMHGSDRLLAATLMLGCDGTVSGVSSAFPEPFVAVYEAYLKKDMSALQAAQKKAVKFAVALRGGSNMAYFKAALDIRGLTGGHMRAPQLDLLPKERADFEKELAELCAETGFSLKA